MDYVYIITNSNGFVKVGVSKNPEKRVKQLQTGNGEKLELIFTEEFACTRKHLLQVEKKIHKNLSTMCSKKTGEWFQISPEQLQSVKNTIIWHRIRYEDSLI